MRDMWLMVVVGSVLVVAVGVGYATYQHRSSRRVVPSRMREPRSLVEVLTTQAAIADAAHRAASFERDAAARANGRAERYEALAASEEVQCADATVHDIGQRIAS